MDIHAAKWPIALVLLIFTMWVSGCGGSPEKEQEPVGQNSRSLKGTKIETRETLMSRLNSLGITVYPGAEFTKIEKAKYGDGYVLDYSIPETDRQSVEKVSRFYSDMMKKVAKQHDLRKMSSSPLIYTSREGEPVITISNYVQPRTGRHLLRFVVSGYEE